MVATWLGLTPAVAVLVVLAIVALVIWLLHQVR